MNMRLREIARDLSNLDVGWSLVIALDLFLDLVLVDLEVLDLAALLLLLLDVVVLHLLAVLLVLLLLVTHVHSEHFVVK